MMKHQRYEPQPAPSVRRRPSLHTAAVVARYGAASLALAFLLGTRLAPAALADELAAAPIPEAAAVAPAVPTTDTASADASMPEASNEAGIASATSAADTADAALAAALQQVIALTNAERENAGLKPLVANDNLTRASQAYADVLAGDACFGHACGAEPDFAERAASAGYTGWTRLGENIAGGQRTPEAVVEAWMKSPGHRANILNPDFTEIGVGMANGGAYSVYWSQEFGTRSSHS